MRNVARLRFLVLMVMITLLAWPAAGFGTDTRVAVASNFLPAARELVTAFEDSTGHRLVLISGSTGKLYAQIRQGAPFDVFLAADSDHPERLEHEDHAVAGSRFTYARGRLVLWGAGAESAAELKERLRNTELRHLAIANPRLAPYGRAARQTLEEIELWGELSPRLVLGENVGQAFHFVASGAAELGFVALSQFESRPEGMIGAFWLVPEELHGPIEQQAILLHESVAGRHFIDFLRSSAARATLERYGYELP